MVAEVKETAMEEQLKKCATYMSLGSIVKSQKANTENKRWNDFETQTKL